MKNNLSHNDFELLQHINPVDAPPFLFTRIQQQVQNKAQQQLKPSLVWGLSVSMLLLLLVNIAALKNEFRSTNKSNETNIVTAMNLHTSNNLYNE